MNANGFGVRAKSSALRRRGWIFVPAFRLALDRDCARLPNHTLSSRLARKVHPVRRIGYRTPTTVLRKSLLTPFPDGGGSMAESTVLQWCLSVSNCGENRFLLAIVVLTKSSTTLHGKIASATGAFSWHRRRGSVRTGSGEGQR